MRTYEGCGHNNTRESALSYGIERAKREHGPIWVYTSYSQSANKRYSTWHVLAHPEPGFQLEFTITKEGDVDFMHRPPIGV